MTTKPGRCSGITRRQFSFATQKPRIHFKLGDGYILHSSPYCPSYLVFYILWNFFTRLSLKQKSDQQLYLIQGTGSIRIFVNQMISLQDYAKRDEWKFSECGVSKRVKTLITSHDTIPKCWLLFVPLYTFMNPLTVDIATYNRYNSNSNIMQECQILDQMLQHD